jgi:lipopolysaccharide transport system permease protein
MSIESIIANPNIADVQSPLFASTVSYPVKTQKELAREDAFEGLKQWRIWMMLSYQDIQLRYRRSVLGPFWLTLSMAITVYSMGYLYGHLFHTDLESYFPFLVSGMLSWTLLSTCVVELTDTYSMADLIKQIKLPYSLYIHRVVMRNIIIFFHNIIVIVPILAIFHRYAKIDWNTLLLLPGLLIFYVNAVTFGLLLSMVGARYRDLSQIIKSFIQVIFFVTPVMWNPALLPEKDRFLVILNPFYSFIELIREPLLGVAPELKVYFISVLVTLVGIVLCTWMFRKYRARIVYWI